MSRLHVFYGDSSAEPSLRIADFDEPATLSYEDHAVRWGRFRNEPVERARSLRTNDCCPRCRRAQVEPLELADGLRTRNNLPIPGSATLVGFHCNSCHWEWPA